MATEIEKLIIALQGDMDQYQKEMAKTVKGTSAGTKRMGQDLKKVEKDTEQFAKVGSFALKAFALVVAGTLVTNKIKEYGDAWTTVQNKLKTVRKPGEDLADTTQRLLNVANETRSSLDSTVTLYSRLSRSSEELNLTQEELIDLTETINKSFAVSGATAQEASSAIIQLSQGLAQGALRGDEFNSVSEQAPIIMEAIVKSTGKTKGELRELAAQGAITSELLVKSLQNYAEAIETDFAKANATVEQASVILNNSMTALVGTLDETVGFTSSTADGMVNLADKLDGLEKPIKDAIDVFTTLKQEMGDAFGEGGTDLETLANTFEVELAFMGDLVKSFIFVLETGLLATPKLIQAAVELGIASIFEIINQGRISILEFRQFIAETLGDETTADIIQTQIDKIAQGTEGVFGAVIDQITEDLAGLGDSVLEFDAKVEATRQARKEAEEEREEEGDEGNEEKKLKDLSNLFGETEKEKTKRLKEEEKKRNAFRKASADLIGSFGEKGKKIQQALFAFDQARATTSIILEGAVGAEKAIGQAGIPGIAIAAGIIAAAATLASSAAGLSIGDSSISAPTPSATTADLPETAGIDVSETIVSEEGTESSIMRIEFTASGGDTMGEAMAAWANDSVRRGLIGPGVT